VITSDAAGSDVAGITTAAEKRGDKYIVNGSKKWITNGIFADYCTAAVRTGGPGRDGVSALIIPLKIKGVTCKKIDNSGVHASGSTYIEFDDVEVPSENLLGQENRGFGIIMSNFNHERLWLACTSLRMARVCAQDAFEHAGRRETFGRPLMANQVIRAKFARFARNIEPVHAYMESLVYLIEHERKRKALRKADVRLLSHAEQGQMREVDLDVGGMVATLKTSAGRVLEKVNREAQQILGGAGYAKSGKGLGLSRSAVM
jgi:alkylation response protein AidB-like acyl-CoA dehydrogenase